jgi:hypothetical protein
VPSIVGLDFARTWGLREGVLFALLGLTLWVPLRDDQWTLPVVEIADTLIWLAAGFQILLGRNGSALDQGAVAAYKAGNPSVRCPHSSINSARSVTPSFW